MQRSSAEGGVGTAKQLEVVRLTKAFGARLALDSVTVTVDKGEIRALVGANGAGKTTIARCIGGLLQPDAGQVTICGHDATRAGRATRRRLGVVSQQLGLYRGLSAWDNLRFFARVMGTRKQGADVALDEIVEQLALESLLQTAVIKLSAGQQRLVHVASALAHKPEVIVLDEATAGLDEESSARLFALLHERARQGAAVLMATHRLDEVEEHCATISILHEGKGIVSCDVASLLGELGHTRAAARPSAERGAREHARFGDDTAAVTQRPKLTAAVESLVMMSVNRKYDWPTESC